MILTDHKIQLIKIIETHQFSGRLSNLCQPPEINYFYKVKSVFELKKKFKKEVLKFSNLLPEFKLTDKLHQ